MALRILDYRMYSDHSHHTARLVPGKQYSWEVSWLPGQHLNRNEAITAMVLADTTAYGDVQPGHRSWPHIEGWADELGMTGSQALDRVAGPPRWATRQKTAEPPDADPSDMERPDTDPLDLGWTDGLDWPEPEYPDPSWRGWGAAARRRPMYLSDLAVSDWHQERHPDKSSDLWRAPGAGRVPQPRLEPDKVADWEAGQ
jgi:hypothetical protein